MIALHQAQDYLDQLDLSYIADAMCAATYPLPRWMPEDAAHCCKLYKNYLFLIKKYESKTLVPTKEIDEFWHNHILYTKQYVNDCQHIFGYYLHHNPLDPNEDNEKLIDNFLLTKKLFWEEFKEKI